METGAKSIQEPVWPILLFNKSALKQRKFRELTALMEHGGSPHSLDIGSDNGVISYLLRKRGGTWKSADLESPAVESIRELVHEEVYQINGKETPFRGDEFDCVVIVDFLEHIHTDGEFVQELYRIIKPGGRVIINVPHIKNTLLRRIRLALGQTDEKHGHVRPGYTLEGLTRLLDGKFTLDYQGTYSGFFSECVDTAIAFAMGRIKKGSPPSGKGTIVTGRDLDRNRKLLRIYSLIYPAIWMVTRLDGLLFWTSGYMLIVRGKSLKSPAAVGAAGASSSMGGILK